MLFLFCHDFAIFMSLFCHGEAVERVLNSVAKITARPSSKMHFRTPLLLPFSLFPFRPSSLGLFGAPLQTPAALQRNAVSQRQAHHRSGPRQQRDGTAASPAASRRPAAAAAAAAAARAWMHVAPALRSPRDGKTSVRGAAFFRICLIWHHFAELFFKSAKQ